MRALILFHSLFGNTRKIAESLANGLQDAGVETVCKGIEEIDISTIPTYDFLAVGGPTHILGASKEMKSFLRELKALDLRGLKGFAFDTRNESGMNKRSMLFLENGAARRIERAMKGFHVKIIRARESALVNAREGPLYPKMEERFTLIGKEIAELLAEPLNERFTQ